MGIQLIKNDFKDGFIEIMNSTEGEIKIVLPFIGINTTRKLSRYLKNTPDIM